MNKEELEKQKETLVNQYKFFKNILNEPAKGERRIYAQKKLDEINEKGQEISSKLKQL